ncbi:unnamed protein product [Zymoseptoria tritici ST99CH_1A5]|uniref:Uncharacterized protein n=1 Tax=Zymoseptoria tritici ST99CH_1A5 TaxID=1276529 RepID=A0A1Y6M0Q5_ZYMTR|nr:unnamed protein product [Zymoseptoria tritici ST99CH_1A5]
MHPSQRSRRHADSEDAEKQENKTDSLTHQLAAALSVKHADGKDNNEEEGKEMDAQGVSLCEAANGWLEGKDLRRTTAATLETCISSQSLPRHGLDKRDTSLQGLNVSWLKKNEQKIKRHVAELRDTILMNWTTCPAPSVAGGSVRAGRSGGVNRSITPATEYKAINNGSPAKTPTMMATTTKSKTSINLPNLESNRNYKAQVRAWTTAPYRTYKSQTKGTDDDRDEVSIAETRQSSSAQSERASRRS